MKFSVSLNSNDSISDAVKKSIELDRLGLDYVWISDLPSQRYAPAVCAAIAQVTSKIRIGLGLISPFLHTPQQIASSLTTLIESYGPRFDLCIGPGDRDELYKVGVDLESHKQIIQSLLNSKKEISTIIQNRKIETNIWIGAQGPKLLKSISVFNGVLLNYSSIEMIEWSINIMKEEGIDGPTIGIFSPSYIYKKINPKIQKMLNYAAAIIALGTSKAVLKEFLLDEGLEPARKEYRSRSLDESILNLIPQNIIKKFSIFISQDDLPKYIQQLKRLRVEHVVFSYPQGYSIETIKELSEGLSKLQK
ncbi:LLM class flavin-dependent oxidoreductase [[Eubacterium] cellulosolvens]